MKGKSLKTEGSHFGDGSRQTSTQYDFSLREVIAIWVVSGVLFFLVTEWFQHSYRRAVEGFGDSSAYIQIANAIRIWNFDGIQVKHFWGLPYAVAAFSRVLFISCDWSLIIVSCLASLCSVILAYRLWGGWIAVYGLSLNLDWLQRSFLGGAEPLFLALLLGSFLMIRKQRWLGATTLAALATITRPLGVFLLLGIGVSLLLLKELRLFLLSLCIAGGIAIAYAIPLHFYLHDSLATVHSYGVLQASQGPHLFGIPFRAIIVGTIAYPAPLSNLLLTFGWIFLVTAGVVAMFLNEEFRRYVRQNLAEGIFLSLYLLALYSYNAPAFARSNFSRFAIPILPYVFLALYRLLPKNKLLCLLSFGAGILSALSAIGLRNVFVSTLHYPVR